MSERGFTLIELMVVFGIIVIMMALAVQNFMGARGQIAIHATAATILSDIKQQQTKAMLGDTEGRESADSYGIHFGSDSYTMFHGESYQANDPNNAIVALPEQLQFSIVDLPSSALVFTKGSGEVVGYSADDNSLTILNPSNNQTWQVRFNQYGIITEAP